MLQNVKVVIEAKLGGVVVPESSKTFESLSEIELLHLERKLLNVMNKMQAFGEAGEHPTGDATRTKLEHSFTAFNGDGSEIAWQGNRWTGIRVAEANVMLGLLAGEMANLDPSVKGKRRGHGHGHK